MCIYQTSNFICAVVLCLVVKFLVLYKMYQSQSTGSRLKPRVQITTVQNRSSHKFQNALNHKNKSCQTLPDKSCEDHTKQITELLTEVAIALGQKAKLENQVAEMKEEIKGTYKKSDETRLRLEQELEKLRRENFEKEVELSKLKIVHLEEQKNLLTEVSNLKSEIKNLNDQNEISYQNLKKEKDQLETKINVSKDDLKQEAEKNLSLQLKLTKYKNKLKYMMNYIQQLLQDFKDKQTTETETDKKISNSVINKPNVEELVLTELFFKPSSFPVEVEEIFFNQGG